jgi:Mn-dependent DtxR family transcriptional regulator
MANGWEQWARADPARQRLVFRIVSGHLVGILSRNARLHDGDLQRAYVWHGLCQGAGGAGEGVRSTVTARGLSRSLAIPHETVRRKLADLKAAGYFLRTDEGGFKLVEGRVHGAAARAATREELASISHAARELRLSGLELSPLGRPAPGTDVELAAMELLRDFQLRCYEAGVGLYGSIVDGAIVMGMLRLNAAPITEDVELAWRYAGADTPPPDDARAPVSIGRVSSLMALPRETVRRRVQRFIKLGWVEQRADGYLVTMARLQAPESLANGAIMAQRFMVLLGHLRGLCLIADADFAASA